MNKHRYYLITVGYIEHNQPQKTASFCSLSPYQRDVPTIASHAMHTLAPQVDVFSVSAIASDKRHTPMYGRDINL